MREIKFRAWDKKVKKWLDPLGSYAETYAINEAHELIYCDLDSIVIGDDCAYLLDECGNYHGLDTERFEIMQFTGLKDRNGKEIYEGDLLDVDAENRIVKVVWFEPEACFDTKPVKIIDKTWPYFPDLLNAQWKYRCEVIGNIYENPELLKGE